MGADEQARELAKRTPNFGYLLPYHALLVTYGAAAEALLFTDPNTAMIKCRQFGEVLAEHAFIQFGIPGMPNTQHARLQILRDQGVVNRRVDGWFTQVRTVGNQAVHEGYAAQRDALELVRACYELGAWYHRTISGSQDAPPFVPPQAPVAQPAPADTADSEALEDIKDLLRRYRKEFVEMHLKLDEQTMMAAAEAAARKAADQEIIRAVQAQAGVLDLVKQLSTQVEALRKQLSDSASNAEPIAPSVRDELVSRAAVASRRLLNEAEVRRNIDGMLAAAGWVVQDRADLNPLAAQGVAVREFTTKGSQRADYLLYVDAKLVGVIEAKREGTSLTGVDHQSARYATDLDASLQLAAWRPTLPFRYESTAAETRFTNTLDPTPRTRRMFSFHRPETIARWMRDAESNEDAPTFRARLRRMPPLIEDELRDAQIEAITELEKSLANDRPRSLIQMATGAGKTFTMVNETYRLLRHAGARRVLFLVDRNNLGKQAQAEFEKFRIPEDGKRFADLYNVQRLRSDVVLDSANVVISTVQRMYALLRGEELPDEDDWDYQVDEMVEVGYNPSVPPETFDLVIVDECHRSIYGKWRAVLEYFDAHMVGLTATPVAQTFGFFHENLVSQYPYRQAVVDGVNVDYDIMRIHTEVGEHGGTILANVPFRIVDLHTRRQRYARLDTNFDYDKDAIGRSVMVPSQIRKVIQTFADRWRQFFPHRTDLPKTLIFAKNDQHADDIVEIVREIFGGDNRFCVKITYKADNPEQLLSDFRNDAAVRVAVTVDMIATGTDVKPLECVLFLRGVSSATYFEQMKGRGARTVDPDDLQDVSPDARAKTKFLLVDAVGVTDSPLVERPLLPPAQRQVSLAKLLERAASQGITIDEAAALGSRLARLNQQINDEERDELADLAGGQTLQSIAQGLERATDVDAQEDALQSGGPEAQRQLVLAAVRPLVEHPELRKRMLSLRRSYDLAYDEHTQDRLLSVRARRMDEDTSRHLVDDWRQYMADNADEITALRIAFGDPNHDWTEVYKQLKRLAAKIKAPPHRWTPDLLWNAYRKLGIAKGSGGRKEVAGLMAILRYELGFDSELRPLSDKVEDNLANWVARQTQVGVQFTPDQTFWLRRLAHAIANRLWVSVEDLDGPPFTQHGGVDGFVRAFGEERAKQLLDELNRILPA